MASMRAVVTGGPHSMLNLFNEKTPILLYMKIRRGEADGKVSPKYI